MVIKINLTKEHLETGRALSCTECPVALAVREALPKKFNVTVGKSGAYAIDNPTDTLYVACLPTSLVNVIRAVDTGNKKYVKPVTEELHFIKSSIKESNTGWILKTSY